MQLTASEISIIRAWADEHRPCVLAVYLFGSRARGTARADSDIDIAIELDLSDAEPPLMGSCFGLYMARGDRWQRELAASLARHVSLEALDGDWLRPIVEREGVLLWRA